MNRYLLLTLSILICLSNSYGQSYTAPGGAITDNGPHNVFPIVVNGLSPQHINTSFGLESVCININHPIVSNLAISLKAPDGTIANLARFNGGSGANFANTCFSISSNAPIYSGTAPFTANYKPVGALGNVNNNQVGNGLWELIVEDCVLSDAGTLVDFTLNFSNNPSLPSSFTSGNLPIIVINTGGIAFRNEPKRKARLGIIDNGLGIVNHLTDPWNNYDGYAMVEYRGSNSATFPQKSFSFETCDINGQELNTSLLSMPRENDWVLIAAYSELSLMRNALTYELANRMGYYASRTRFCEVVVDGQYEGVYILAEKIKRDDNRVAIAKLEPEDIIGDELTGGYIIKIDRPNGNVDDGWSSQYPPPNAIGPQTIAFQYEYPKAADRQPEQEAYIQAYVDSFENALASPDFADINIGYRRFADMNSFIDNFIINEMSRNVDAYALSYFFHKDKNSNGGKLKSGPVWDYDIAFANAGWCNSNWTAGWAYNLNQACPTSPYLVPFWWKRMLQDTNYTNALKCRWDDLRTSTLSNTAIFGLIDSNAAYLNEAHLRHYAQWSITESYENAINDMKDWIALRMAWLDTHMPGNCYPSITSEHLKTTNTINIYPTPFSGDIKLDFTTPYNDHLTIRIYSSVGQLVYSETLIAIAGKNNYNLVIGELMTSGEYLLQATAKDYSYSQRIIKQAK